MYAALYLLSKTNIVIEKHRREVMLYQRALQERMQFLLTKFPVMDIAQKYAHLKPYLNERSRRLWCAVEAEAIGNRGITAVHKATGVSRPTIHKDIKELTSAHPLPEQKTRHSGGGRQKLTTKHPDLLRTLKDLVSPATRGDPEQPLLWSSKSTIKLAQELQSRDYRVTQRTVYTLLKKEDYRMKTNKKTKEGAKAHPDRDTQFLFINQQVLSFQSQGAPVLSVDTK